MVDGIARGPGLNGLGASAPWDVCIVGSGFVGSVLGALLVRRGIRTVVVESGGSTVRWFADPSVKASYRYTVSGDADYPTARTRARAIGGTSNFWTGRCNRLHPSDFEPNPYTPPGNPWPIRYEDVERHYCAAESMLRVRGRDPSVHLGPRSMDYPRPPSTDISALQRRLARAGVVVDYAPTATPQRWIRFFRLSREILPEFRRSPHGTLLERTTVTRLVAGDDGRITAAEVRAPDGSAHRIRARMFVLGGGGIETPRLLLLSRSERFPTGIGNRFDRVGRGFNEHLAFNLYGRIPHDRSTVLTRHEVGRSHQFYDDLRSDGLGAMLGVFIQSWVFPNHLMRNALTDLPAALRRIAGRLRRATQYAGAVIEIEPRDENRVTLGREVDRFGDPLAHLHFSLSERDRETLHRARRIITDVLERLGASDIIEAELTWCRHHIGACRMGTDPRRSVVDPNLRVHDCPNLFLCGAETFVTGGAAEPTLLIVALAHRLSEHLEERLRFGNERSGGRELAHADRVPA